MSIEESIEIIAAVSFKEIIAMALKSIPNQDSSNTRAKNLIRGGAISYDGVKITSDLWCLGKCKNGDKIILMRKGALPKEVKKLEYEIYDIMGRKIYA